MVSMRRSPRVALWIMSGAVPFTGCATNEDVVWSSGITTEFALDADDAPQLEAWGRDILALAREELPRIAELLGEAEVPERITIVIQEQLSSVGKTSGTTIRLRASWFEATPSDRGAVVHELVHVFQRYPGARPQWLVEGIADWVRWEWFEPERNRYALSPGDRLDEGYQVAAAFLDYLSVRYGKRLVVEIHRRLRAGSYDRSFFEGFTGRALEDLWDEYRRAGDSR